MLQGCVTYSMCVDCVCGLLSCFWVCMIALFCLFRVWLCMGLPLHVARIAFHITRGFCVRAFGLFDFACMLVFCAIVYALAFCMLQGCVP